MFVCLCIGFVFLLFSVFFVLCVLCPGHVRVKGNGWADRLTSTADIMNSLLLGKADMLRSLRNFMSTDRPERYSIDHQKGTGVGKGIA